MKAMICEMCGGNEVVKTGGMYVCQHCRTKYDVEEARKLFVTISGPVVVDGISTADNLMERAQEFFDKGDETKALEYVERVLDIDARNERARAMQTAIFGPSALHVGSKGWGQTSETASEIGTVGDFGRSPVLDERNGAQQDRKGATPLRVSP